MLARATRSARAEPRATRPSLARSDIWQDWMLCLALGLGERAASSIARTNPALSTRVCKIKVKDFAGIGANRSSIRDTSVRVSHFNGLAVRKVDRRPSRARLTLLTSGDLFVIEIDLEDMIATGRLTDLVALAQADLQFGYFQNFTTLAHHSHAALC